MLYPPRKTPDYRTLLRQMWPHRHHSFAARLATRRLLTAARSTPRRKESP